jgi:hypothetical protein
MWNTEEDQSRDFDALQLQLYVHKTKCCSAYQQEVLRLPGDADMDCSVMAFIV